MSLDLNFSYNWNNKLSAHAFTTIRLFNPAKYIIGCRYDVKRKGKFLKRVRIQDVRNIKLQDINDYVSYLDTGYSARECRDMIMTMYKNIVKDWSTQLISFILLVTEDKRSQNTTDDSSDSN